MSNTTEQTRPPVPEGYMRNAAGHMVPLEEVRPHDKLRDQVAKDLVQEAADLHERLKQFKKRALDDIDDLVTISGERYGVSLGGKKGNVTVATYDGDFKVVRSYAERITVTEETEAARELINQCIMRWSEGANNNIKALVDRAFHTTNQGKLKMSAILDLLRLDIEDEQWQKAMEALKDSIQVTGTAVYVRVYKRVGKSDQYVPVPLDLAAV